MKFTDVQVYGAAGGTKAVGNITAKITASECHTVAEAAALIKAAPDLLNMLTRLHAEIMHSEAVFSQVAALTLEQVRNAIAKATQE